MWLWLAACGGPGEVPGGVDVWSGSWEERVWTIDGPACGINSAVPRIAVGDVDADGAADLAVSSGFCYGDQEPDLVVHRGGAEGPHPPLAVPLGEESPRAVSQLGIGDLDGDGFDDLVFTRDQSLTWRRGGASGVPGDPEVVPLEGALHAMPDLGRDGRDDLLVFDAGWALIPGVPGALADAPRLPLVDVVGGVVAVGDVNGDGVGDLLGSGGELFLLGPGGVPLGSRASPAGVWMDLPPVAGDWTGTATGTWWSRPTSTCACSWGGRTACGGRSTSGPAGRPRWRWRTWTRTGTPTCWSRTCWASWRSTGGARGGSARARWPSPRRT